MACATNSMTLSQKINHNFSEQRISDMRDSCKVYDEVMIKHSFFFLSTYFAHKKDEPKVRKKTSGMKTMYILQNLITTFE